jgi:long-chain acyl-CoA synthetase
MDAVTMSDHPWFAAYPQGVPHEIDPDAYPSLVALLEASFERCGDAPAFSNLGTTLSFRETEERSRAFAAWLQSRPGYARGTRVAVMLPNLLQSVVVILGILRAGMTVVNVNPLYTKRELEHQLTDSGARTIVVLENFAATVEKVREKTQLDAVVVTRVADHCPAPKRQLVNFAVRWIKRMVPAWNIPDAIQYRAALAAGSGAAYERPEPGAEDIAFLQYTGGTTGLAKGAVLTHRNMVANVLQAAAWSKPFFDREHGSVVSPLPLYHIFSLTVNLFAFIELGGHNVLITNPRDLPAFIGELRRTRMAALTGVNTLFNALLHTKGFADLDFSQLKIVLGGGMAVQRKVAETWREVTGVTISQGYGLTETSPIVSANPLDMKEFNGSVGLPVPSTEVAIFDDDGRTVPIDEPGEICVRGPQVMKEYWNRPEDTAAAFFADGWFRTGDIGHIDAQGFVYIEDRKKDMINVSGFNVYPNEVEDVVAAHPGVLEAAAIGVPSEESGEAVKLYVVRKDHKLDADSLITWCREHLTGYKIPRAVEFVDELPKSNIGKILRRELRDRETKQDGG